MTQPSRFWFLLNWQAWAVLIMGALTTAILERLGATPEQIDRERERSHRTLFGAAATEDGAPATSPAARTTS